MADILHKIDIDTTADKVYSAVSSNQGLKSWWTTDVAGDSFLTYENNSTLGIKIQYPSNWQMDNYSNKVAFFAPVF